VLSIEPTQLEAGDSRDDIEDMVLVTDSGCELLSRAFDPSELYVIS
jgi:Xaa-Pro aminopeptidase